MSDAALGDHRRARETASFPTDLSEADLAAAPVLASIDALLIDGLTDDEDDSFAAATSS